MSDILHQHEAEDRVVETIISVLATHLESEGKALYNMHDGETQPGGTGVYQAGIYLPLPEAADYHRQSGPTAGDTKDVGKVSVFVGPVSGAVPVSRNGGFGGGIEYSMQQSFAVAFIFARAANGPIEDPATGRKLREEEIFVKRARLYTGLIAHTVWKHCRGRIEIRRTEPGPRESQQAEMQISDDQYQLIGVSSYEFAVYNEQFFPAFQR